MRTRYADSEGVKFDQGWIWGYWDMAQINVGMRNFGELGNWQGRRQGRDKALNRRKAGPDRIS